MHPDTALPAIVPDRRLAESGAMRVSDLNRAERLVVCALRDERWHFDPTFFREAALI